MNVVNDMEVQIQKVNKIIHQVSELQEANKDVLLGKRKLNCLACGADNNKDTNVQGADGKMYKSINPKSKEYGADPDHLKTEHVDRQSLVSPGSIGKTRVQ